jgi:PIN domain nuclease of toxin-antitoxin system
MPLTKRNDALSVEQLADLDAALNDPEVNIHVLPVTVEVARLASEPAKADLPDPFDRLILATAKANGLTLVSPDRLMRNLSIAPAIW